MNKRISSAVLLFIAALAPASAPAATIDISPVELTAFGAFSTQLQPAKIAEDRQSAPLGSLTPAAEVLVLAEGLLAMPFPNVPTTQTRPFASSSSNANGNFGIGVNGFFFQNSLPPHDLLASGTTTVTYTNNSGGPLNFEAEFFIPAPTIRFFGVGLIAPGVDPARDATATAVIDLIITIINPNGDRIESIAVDYGLLVARGLPGPVLLAFPRRDGVGKVTRFDEPDGSFGFLLPDFESSSVGTLPADSALEFAWHYTAQAHTGFGETGIFAAIGDPFNLSTGGARFNIQVGPAAAIPEPATLATLGLGLVVLAIYARRGRPSQPSPGSSSSRAV